MMFVRYAKPEDIPFFSDMIKKDVDRQPVCFHYDVAQALVDAEELLKGSESFGLVAYTYDEHHTEALHGLWIGKIARLPGATLPAIMDIIALSEHPDAWMAFKDMLVVLARLHGCGGVVLSISGRKEEVARRWLKIQGANTFAQLALIDMMEVH